MKSVDAVVVSYNTREMTERAIHSVLAEPETRRVIVVDNDSRDGSCEHLRSRFASAPVSVVGSGRNLGFGAACNRAARIAAAELLFFLNSDAVVRPGCLAVLRSRLLAEPDIGLVAPGILASDGRTLQMDAQGSFPTVTSLLTRRDRVPPDVLEPDWISGVAFMARRQEYLEIGGFSEELFLYFEDVELCRRYRQGGKRIVRVPAASVIHLGGQSQRSREEQKRHYYASQDRYLRLAGASWLGCLLVKLARSAYVLWTRALAKRRARSTG